MNAARLTAILLVVFLSTPALADDAREDVWWQLDGRDRSGYVGAGVEVVFPGASAAGELGDNGNFEVTTGYWVLSMLAAELQVSLGRDAVTGSYGQQVAESTHTGVAAGVRWGLPIRLTPVVAAHVGYRHTLSRSVQFTCGDECPKSALLVDDRPDEQGFADAEAGLQLNLGVFSVLASVEYCRPFSAAETTDVQVRRAPGDSGRAPAATVEAAHEVALNLQAGVRF
ncbi:MAG: hypothetical protein KC620_19115 [Myxococcales bacterium]|nr:hypothetical protein [Myxococcales bacterium]